MADLQRLCIDGSCSDVTNYTAGENITITGRVISATNTTYDNATQSAPGLMSAADKTKLDGIEAGAEPNQNAFSNVQVGSTTVAADSETDTLTLAAGTNVTLTPNASADSITISVPDVYTKAQTDALIDAITTGEFVVVQTLPSTGDPKNIYLVPNGGTAPNVYDEYVYVNGGWEKIGTTQVDLSNYYNKTETDNLLAGKQNTLTAGSNIQISGNTISATDTKYTAGTNVQISSANVISATDTKYDAATATPKMDGTGTVGTSVKYAREDHIHPKDTSKQDKLTAGSNITISGTTISATDTTNNFYATSATAAATVAKTATVQGSESFVLKEGVIVGVKATATNTAENPTLNVNGTGAKSIYYNNAVVTSSNLWAAGYANRLQYYMYDGTYWVWMSHSLDNNTTYTNMTQTEATTGTATTARAISAKVLNDTIDAKVKTYTGTSPITVSGTTISHAASGVTAASKGDTSNQTPAFGGTFKALSGTVNATGHLTAFAEHTVKIPNTAATTSAAGLMSAADKTKLDGLTDTTNNFYATSSTGAGTAAKVATVQGNETFVLKVGAIVGVKFTTTNTAASPTLNVNSTGAKPIYYDNAVVTDENKWAGGVVNHVLLYMYDGTNWICLGEEDYVRSDGRITSANV